MTLYNLPAVTDAEAAVAVLYQDATSGSTNVQEYAHAAWVVAGYGIALWPEQKKQSANPRADLKALIDPVRTTDENGKVTYRFNLASIDWPQLGVLATQLLMEQLSGAAPILSNAPKERISVDSTPPPEYVPPKAKAK